jgi:hypothetical protein
MTHEMNWAKLELFVKAGSTEVRIAKGLGISVDTLARRVKEKYSMTFKEFAEKLRSEGESLIEAKQFDKAMNGYWPALQWLGKIRLGQKEPEMQQQQAANQGDIDKDHIIMMQKNEIERLRANADKSETG